MNILKNKSIAAHFIVLVSIPTGIIMAIIIAFTLGISRHLLFKLTNEDLANATQAKVKTIEYRLRPAYTLATALSEILSNMDYYDEKELDFLLNNFISSNADVIGMSITFKPYKFNKYTKIKSFYHYQEPVENGFVYIKDRIGEQYLAMDWYQIPIEGGHNHWSEPYIETRSQTLMVTYSSLIHKKLENGNKEIVGVVTADFSLDWLDKLMKDIKITKSSYSVLISRDGIYLTYPNKDVAMNETVFSRAEDLNDARLYEIGKKMVGGETGMGHLGYDAFGRRALISFAPIELNGWSVGIAIPSSELYKELKNMSYASLGIMTAGLILLVLTIVLIVRSLTKPIEQMVELTDKLAKGNLDLRLPKLTGIYEITRLERSFNKMTLRLKRYIKELTESTASKQRIESELAIAKNIQFDMLPTVFPPFPGNMNIDVFAVLQPAREVGGDFYDFYFTDNDHLSFVIGDVSGKGVPASLFMAVTKTLLKATGANNPASPDEILRKVNEELAASNDNSMFVTIFLCVLNIKTGELVYSNAGHNMPVIVGKNGRIEFMEQLEGLVLGIMPGTQYKKAKITLTPGDRMFLYTDGVTEAQDAEKTLFGEEALIAALKKYASLSSKEITENLLKDLEDYSGAEQADDITMMMVDFLKRKE